MSHFIVVLLSSIKFHHYSFNYKNNNNNKNKNSKNNNINNSNNNDIYIIIIIVIDTVFKVFFLIFNILCCNKGFLFFGL